MTVYALVNAHERQIILLVRQKHLGMNRLQIVTE